MLDIQQSLKPTIAIHRARCKQIAESKLRLALADHERRDFRSERRIELLWEWVESFNHSIPPVPVR